MENKQNANKIKAAPNQNLLEGFAPNNNIYT